MNKDKAIKDLLAALGKDKISTDRGDLRPYSKDNSYHHPEFPVAVVYAKEELDLIKALKICNNHKISVIPFAAGSSLEGHVIPLPNQDSVVIDVSAMDSVTLHEKDLAVTAGPGVGWMDLNRQLADSNLFFPPDPGAAACVGGMCATNCSGTLAWRYGTMKDNVLGLRVVLSDGRVITTRGRVTKSSSGYDLTRLFIGSEGTLGLISSATLRLRRLPPKTTVSLVQFPTLELATDFVHELVRSGPESLHRIELMDDVCITSTNFTSPWKLPELTTVLIEFAGTRPETLSEHSRVCADIAAKYKSSGYQEAAHSLEEAEKYWSVRKKALFAAKLLRPELTKDKVTIMITDVAVPISRLSDILHYTKELITELKLIAPIVAHAGDGNFHCFVVLDRTNKDEMRRSEILRDKMAYRAIEYDGTPTGEHGIGSGKRELLLKELGPETVGVMRQIKKALDPNSILNPGKVFTLIDERASTSPPIPKKSKL
ncbi:hypothetical protein BJ742DRAFT_905619 [Cladochytrium replicatum]|nr:hypothetical protein BJ742DRAFT_905619 [Cladochytrium replicatum]